MGEPVQVWGIQRTRGLDDRSEEERIASFAAEQKMLEECGCKRIALARTGDGRTLIVNEFPDYESYIKSVRYHREHRYGDFFELETIVAENWLPEFEELKKKYC